MLWGGLAILRTVSEESFRFIYFLCQSKEFKPSFIVDDTAASAERVSGEFLLREQNRNYLRVGKNLVEIITREDAKFLYLEGRIKKFALLEPDNFALAELKNFYTTTDEDVLIFKR